jgi:hypothetical protein
MASEKTANRARELFSDHFFANGAHGLAVDKVLVDGVDTFALIAMVPPGHKTNLPKTVPVTVGGKEIAVPVVVRKSEPFVPE